MKKTIVLSVLFGITLLSSTSFAASCKKLQMVRDNHFQGECVFDEKNAGSLEDTDTKIKLIVKCSIYSDNIFHYNKRFHKQFTYSTTKVNANSGLSSHSDEDDQYFQKIETKEKIVKLTTWSVRLGKGSVRSSVFKCND